MHLSLFLQVVLAGVVLAFESFKLEFEVHRGKSARDMKRGVKPTFRKRHDSVEVELDNQKSYYISTLKFGSHEEEISVVVDTGSSDLWIVASNVDCNFESSSSLAARDVVVGEFSTKSSPVELEERADAKESVDVGVGGGGLATSSYEGSNACLALGSLNTDESSSFQVNSTAPDFFIEYADRTNATGVWAHDTVVVGNVTVDDLSFAVVNETSSDVGVLGIGLPGLETTYSSGRDVTPYQYENLPLKLRNQGSIAKNAYSLYLGSSDAETGSVLFGAVDHAKYTGTLETVPLINTLRNYGYDETIRLEIAVLGVKVNNSYQFTNTTSRDYTALLDSGSTISYFPASLSRSFSTSVGGIYDPFIGAYAIDCDRDDFTVTFDFSGKTIQVPIQELILTYDGSCYIGVLTLSRSHIILGDNVLRSAYVVYDLEDKEISLAQAKYTDEEDIEIISLVVPSAVQAANYSLTILLTGWSPTGYPTNVADSDNDDSGSVKDSAGFVITVSHILAVVAAVVGVMVMF